MGVVVRCPVCLSLSRVGAAVVGRMVACPTCGDPFRAAPVPVVPVATRLPDPDPLHVEADGLTGVLLGLALAPLGVPLLWMAARPLLQINPVFSVVAPLAVGLGVAGLVIGVAMVNRWSHAARVRAALGLVVGGYLTGAILFVVPRDVPAAARKLFGPNRIQWKEFKRNGIRLPYQVQLPNGTATETDTPVDGWKLRTFTVAAGQPDDKRGVWAVRYTLADGVPPGDATAADDAWFAAVRDAVVAASGGELTAELPLNVAVNKPARELRLTLPDRVTHRVVRLVRTGDTLVYAAAEGLFLSADGAEVQRFLSGLKVR